MVGVVPRLALGLALYSAAAVAFMPQSVPHAVSLRGTSVARAPALKAGVYRRKSSSLRMGLFDGFAKAVNDGLKTPGAAPELETADLNSFEGFIQREGMRVFTFDDRPASKMLAVGTYSMGGRKAPSGAPAAPAAVPASAGWSPFGFLQAKPGAMKKGEAKENQDGLLVQQQLYDGVSLYSVFDGHGENGAVVTQWCIDNFPAYISEALAEGRAGQLLNRITDAYRKADADMINTLGFENVEDSGTTVATVLQKGDLVLIAGLGDSRVVLGLQEEGCLAAQAVTLDQSPTVAAERKRIEAAGGEVRGEGVGRVYAKGKGFPGLAVSRAFGDADGKSIGVTVDPQFIGWRSRPDVDWCIVAASDGVWNAIGNENVIDICAKFRAEKDAQGAAQTVCETARRVWEAVAKGRIDDISAIVIFL